MKFRIQRILFVVMGLSIMFCSASIVKAIPGGIYFGQCRPGQYMAFYDLTGKVVGLDGYCGAASFTFKFIVDSGARFGAPIQPGGNDGRTEFLYLPMTAGIVHLQTNPRDIPRFIESRIDPPKAESFEDIVFRHNVEKSRMGMEVALFPTVYVVRSGRDPGIQERYIRRPSVVAVEG